MSQINVQSNMLKLLSSSLATKAIVEVGGYKIPVSKNTAIEFAEEGNNFRLEVLENLTRKVRDKDSNERVEETRQTLVVSLS